MRLPDVLRVQVYQPHSIPAEPGNQGLEDRRLESDETDADVTKALVKDPGHFRPTPGRVFVFAVDGSGESFRGAHHGVQTGHEDGTIRDLVEVQGQQFFQGA